MGEGFDVVEAAGGAGLGVVLVDCFEAAGARAENWWGSGAEVGV